MWIWNHAEERIYDSMAALENGPRHALGRILLASIEGLVAYAGATGRATTQIVLRGPTKIQEVSGHGVSQGLLYCTRTAPQALRAPLHTLTWYSATELLMWLMWKNMKKRTANSKDTSAWSGSEWSEERSGKGPHTHLHPVSSLPGISLSPSSLSWDMKKTYCIWLGKM